MLRENVSRPHPLLWFLLLLLPRRKRPRTDSSRLMSILAHGIIDRGEVFLGSRELSDLELGKTGWGFPFRCAGFMVEEIGNFARSGESDFPW